MNFIPIKKETKSRNGIVKEYYIIPAMSINQLNGSVKKVPHPHGSEFIMFDTFAEAQEVVARSGYTYVSSFDDSKNILKDNVSNSSYCDLLYFELINLINDKSSNVVAAALHSLGEIRNSQSIPYLIEKIGEDNEQIRLSAMEALVKHGSSCIEPLIQALQDENWVKKNSAVICLGNLANAKYHELEFAVIPLVDLLKEQNNIVRASVAHTLGKIYTVLKQAN